MVTRVLAKALAASVAAGVATLALTPSARAAEPRSVVVHHADLNLASDAGARTLHARLKTAARAVCATTNRVTLAEQQEISACQRTAAANAQEPVARLIALARSDTRFAAADGTARTSAR